MRRLILGPAMLAVGLLMMPAGLAAADSAEDCAAARQQLEAGRKERLAANQAAAEAELRRIFEEFDRQTKAELTAIHDIFTAEVEAIQARRPKTGTANENFAVNRALDKEIGEARARYHEKRGEILKRLRGRYHEQRRAILKAMREEYSAINTRFRKALRQIAWGGENCAAVVEQALAVEDEPAPPPGFADPEGSDEAALGRRIDELEAQLADQEVRADAYRRDFDRYTSEMNDMLEEMDQLKGRDGTDAAWRKTREDLKRRLDALVNEEADGAMQDWATDRVGGERTDHLRSRMKPWKALESNMRRMEVLHHVFRDALQNHFDETLVDDKQRLINRYRAIDRHRKGLGDLIELERTRRQETLDRLRKIRAQLKDADAPPVSSGQGSEDAREDGLAF